MPTTQTRDPRLKQPSTPFTEADGWGADRNPADRPAVPKEKPSTVTTVRGLVPPRMQPKVKIHMSIEHPDLTPVFGTTCPPRGLSGRLRDFAYQFSEGRQVHWLTLLLADRIDVAEGRLEDLGHARLPNPYKERGWKAELTHADRTRQARAVMLAGVGITMVALGVMLARAYRDDD